MNPGTFHFRPWMLPHRHDYGLRGTADADLWHSFLPFILFNLMLYVQSISVLMEKLLH